MIYINGGEDEFEEEEEEIDLVTLVEEIRQIDNDTSDLDERIGKFTKELGIESPFGGFNE